MSDFIRAGAKTAIKLRHLATAARYCFGAGLYGAAGCWCISIQHWLTVTIGIILALQATAWFITACEAYLAACPDRRPDEQQRFLASRSLYIPRPPGRPDHRQDDRRQ